MSRLSRFNILSRFGRLLGSSRSSHSDRNSSPRSARQSPAPSARPLRTHTLAGVITCIVVVALLAGIAAFANTAVGYIPVLAVVVLIVLDVAYLVVLKRGVSFERREHAASCTRTESLDLPLAIANKSFLPAPRIDVLFTIKDGLGAGAASHVRRLTLPPRSDNVFDLGVRFDHLGTVEVGIRQVAVHDLLGLFSSVRSNDALERVQVLPHVVALGSWDVSEHSVRESQTNVKTYINDGMDYSGIRDYRWGDPMKSIHWKLSSKTEGTYFTRLYEKPTTPGLAIFVDLECPAGDDARRADVYDAVVESALSIERYAAAAGYDTELLYVGSGGSYERIEGPLGNRYGDLMQRMPRLQEGEGVAAQGLVVAESRSVACQNNLVVCTCNVTDALLGTLTSVANPMRRPFLVAIAPSSGDGDAPSDAQKAVLRRLQASRLPHVRIGSAADLEAQVG